jgi:hypothetical protein
MFVRLHSRRKKKAYNLFLLIYDVNLQAHIGWFLFFMKPLVNVTPIDTWDYERMKSYTYMKEGNSVRRASF